jgi:hypothetical protein
VNSIAKKAELSMGDESLRGDDKNESLLYVKL